jgi:hypothetical protein
MEKEPKYKGVAIVLDGRPYILPAMNGTQFERLLEFNENPNGHAAPLGTYRMMLSVVGATLRRNYPDLTDDMLRDQVESTQLEGLFNALVEASGLKRQATGEVVGGAAPGPTSEPGSSQPRDGQ